MPSPNQAPAPTYTGAGTRIAVIGSGVDYTHIAFGGAGTVEAYAANDPTRIEAGSFPNAVVVGGHDFVGERYSADCPEPPFPDQDCSAQAMPDADPLDVPGGPGTEAAGVAAGRAFAGDPAWGPGAAPDATIVALKVLGRPENAAVATTPDLVAEALDWVARYNAGQAVPGTVPADRRPIQVVLLALPGTVRGEARERTRLQLALENLGRRGVTAITPVAGSGNLPFAGADPAASWLGLTVGAAYGEDVSTWGIQVVRTSESGPEVQDLEAIEGGDWLPQLRETGVITGDLAWFGLACDEAPGQAQPPVQPVEGKIALIERGTCTFPVKMNNAAQFGAIAVVMLTDQRPKTALTCGNPCEASPGIPGAMIDNGPGVTLRERLLAGEHLAARLDPDHRIPLTARWNTLLPASGRGPGAQGLPDRGQSLPLIQPQLTAPGADIAAPLAGSGSDLVTRSNPLRAAARAAGTALRLHERFDAQGRGLEAWQAASLLANFAQPIIRMDRQDTGPLAPIMRQGSGAMQPEASLSASTVVWAGATTLSYGHPRLTDGTPQDDPDGFFALTNLADRRRHFRSSYRFAFPDEDEGRGVALRIEPEKVAVDPGGGVQVDANLDIDPAVLRPWRLDQGNAFLAPEILQETEIDGWVLVEETDAEGEALPGGDRLHIPFHVLPRRAACVEALRPGPYPPRGAQPSTVTLANDCLEPGILRPVLLSGTDPHETWWEPALPWAGDIEAVGLRFGPATPGEPDAPTILEWHVRTKGARRLPSDAAIDILLDIDRDGTFDRIVTSIYGPDARAGLAPGQWVAVNAPFKPGTLDPDFSRMLPDPLPVVYDLDETVTRLRVNADDLLIDPASGEETFDFAVRTRAGWVDHAPDLGPGGNPLRPPAYTFDQAALACLAISGPDGLPLTGLAEDIPVPAFGKSSLSLSLAPGCDRDSRDLPPGIMLGLPNNPTDEQQAWIWRAAPPALYLPRVVLQE